MTDEELTQAYLKYCDMVYRIALIQTKSQTQAEDIQQDVFMALVRYSDRILSEEHLKAWLIRVTQNACRKHFRSLWIRLTVLYDDTLYKEQEDESGGTWSPPGQEAPEPEETEEETALVREIVEELPEQSRAVIHLFYYEELSVKQIAQALGISESNTKTRLSRARGQIRKIIEERRS